MSAPPYRPRRRPRLPAFVLGLITFSVLVVVGDLVVVRLAAPALLRNTDLAHLKPTLVQIVLIIYLSTFMSAVIAGVASGLRGLRRGSVSRAGNFFSALFGILLAPALAFCYALLASLPVPGRATEINIVLIALGAFLGCLLVESIKAVAREAPRHSRAPVRSIRTQS